MVGNSLLHHKFNKRDVHSTVTRIRETNSRTGTANHTLGVCGGDHDDGARWMGTRRRIGRDTQCGSRQRRSDGGGGRLHGDGVGVHFCVCRMGSTRCYEMSPLCQMVTVARSGCGVRMVNLLCFAVLVSSKRARALQCGKVIGNCGPDEGNDRAFISFYPSNSKCNAVTVHDSFRTRWSCF